MKRLFRKETIQAWMAHLVALWLGTPKVGCSNPGKGAIYIYRQSPVKSPDIKTL